MYCVPPGKGSERLYQTLASVAGAPQLALAAASVASVVAPVVSRFSTNGTDETVVAASNRSLAGGSAASAGPARMLVSMAVPVRTMSGRRMGSVLRIWTTLNRAIASAPTLCGGPCGSHAARLRRHCGPRDALVDLIRSIRGRRGDVAQLGEHFLCKEGVRGSSPLISTNLHAPTRSCSMPPVIHRTLALLFVAALLAACSTTQQTTSAAPSASFAASGTADPTPPESPADSPSQSAEATVAPTATEPPIGAIYAGPASGVIDPRVADLPARVYVPNETSNDVAVIDPATFEVVDRISAGSAPEHISPDWDLSKLYVSNMNGATLTVIDSRTQEATETMEVPFPYNTYFSPDGSKAIIVADNLGMDMFADNGLYFYDRETWDLLKFVQVPWPGVNHLDFSADGSYLMVTTESAGVVVKIDVAAMEIIGTVEVGGSPLDIRLGPDGDTFYVANQGTHGVDVIDAEALEAIGFIPTSTGAHAFAFSRDATRLFVTNRLNNTISVIDLATRAVVDTWEAGGSPDMATVSPAGS